MQWWLFSWLIIIVVSQVLMSLFTLLKLSLWWAVLSPATNYSLRRCSSVSLQTSSTLQPCSLILLCSPVSVDISLLNISMLAHLESNTEALSILAEGLWRRTAGNNSPVAGSLMKQSHRGTCVLADSAPGTVPAGVLWVRAWNCPLGETFSQSFMFCF